MRWQGRRAGKSECAYEQTSRYFMRSLPQQSRVFFLTQRACWAVREVFYCIPIGGGCRVLLLFCNRRGEMPEKTDVWQGTLALMVLRTLESMGTMHGYGLARRIEQISGDRLQLNYGTLIPRFSSWSRKASSARVGVPLK